MLNCWLNNTIEAYTTKHQKESAAVVQSVTRESKSWVELKDSLVTSTHVMYNISCHNGVREMYGAYEVIYDATAMCHRFCWILGGYCGWCRAVGLVVYGRYLPLTFRQCRGRRISRESLENLSKVPNEMPFNCYQSEEDSPKESWIQFPDFKNILNSKEIIFKEESIFRDSLGFFKWFSGIL